MSEHGNCQDCGGSDGHHYNDCIYDGTSGGCSSYSKRSSSDLNPKTYWIWYILALIIGYSINELLGVIIMIALIFWMCVK